jgi:predicted hotdog family 3-hydroxylacyl-ACP dehydratase
MQLDRAWIEKNIPHQGMMCLLDEVLDWDAQHIKCRSGTHRRGDHPLRSHDRLGAACGIEYAAQAMAVHGALIGGALTKGAPAGGALAGALAAAGLAGEGAVRPKAGFLAALRCIRLHVLRLDDVEGDLICDASLVAGDGGTALYDFALTSQSQPLLSGRATVVFDANQRLNL